jgi:Putative phage tail protein
MEAFLLQAFWGVLFSVAASVLAPDPEKPADAKAATADDVNAPTISEGSAVQVIVGSVLTSRQNVSWYGGLQNVPITQQGVVTGHKYSLTAQLSVCHGPVGEIREIRLDDTVIPPEKFTRTVAADYWDYDIDALDLLGGEGQEGGISGTLRVYRGTLAQLHDADMATLIGAPIPAYRGICYAIMRNMYLGTSARLKGLSFLVEHHPNMLGITGDKHIVSAHRDANAVCVLYDIFRNEQWGGAMPAGLFDTASWLAAADTAYAEGLGISMSLATMGLEEAVETVKKYLDAVVFEDPETGLITLKLVREADLTGAPTFGRSSISEVNISRLGWADIRNTVKVTFTDPTRNYETGGVMAQNSAAVSMTGGAQDVETRDTPGFTNRAIAQVVAERILRSVSYPLSKVELRGNRALAGLRPGSAFRLQWTRPTIDAYYRVMRVEHGALGEATISINAVEDVFSAAAGTFTPPPDSGWVGEGGTLALPATVAALIEAPYHLARADTRTALYGAAAPSSAHTGWRAIVNGSTADQTIYGWMMHAPIAAAIPQWSASGVLASLTLSVTAPASVQTPSAAQYDAGEALLLVDGELMAYRTVARNADGTTTFGTIARAVLDTVPAAHAVGARVIVLASLPARPALGMTADGQVAIGAQTMTSSNTQDPIEAATSLMTTVSRAVRPYAPGALAVNGVVYGAGPHTYPATVTWTPRSRAQVQVLDQLATGVTAEAGTSYTLEVYGADGTTLLSSHPTTGTSHVLADHGNMVLALRSSRGGYDSLQVHRIAVTVASAANHLLGEGNQHITTEAGGNLSTE